MTMTFQIQPNQFARDSRQFNGPATCTREVVHRYQPRRDTVTESPQMSTERRGAQPALRKGPALVVVLIIVAAVLGFGTDVAASGPVAPVSSSSEIADSIEIYIVQPGDTLWGIAASIALPGEDVRPLVDELQEATGGSMLEIGQQIVIDHAMIRG